MPSLSASRHENYVARCMGIEFKNACQGLFAPIQLTWRRQAPDRFDPEKVFGILLSGYLIAVLVFIRITPNFEPAGCHFKQWTGLPCPTCGASRTLDLALQGRIMAAFAMQPLAMAAMLLLLGYVMYSWAVVLFRCRRLRFEGVTSQQTTFLIFGGLILVIVNWAYLIVMKR